jgi:hypothetical protein
MAAAALERRYRRLLACYPARHREVYGEEMIGVLLAAAPAGRRRPNLADTADLFGGGLRVRLRALMTGSPDPQWRDALALTSLIAPLLLFMLHQDLVWISLAVLRGQVPSPVFGLVSAGMLLVPLVLSLLRLRWVASGAAIALMVWMLIEPGFTGAYDIPRFAGYLVLLAIEAVALAASPGPRHALTLIRPKGVLMALPWIATAAYAGGLVPTHYPLPQFVLRVAIVLIAMAGLPALITPLGGRLIMLVVVIPGSTFAASLLTFAGVQFYDLSLPDALLARYLPPTVLAAVLVVVARHVGAAPARPEPGVAA